MKKKSIISLLSTLFTLLLASGCAATTLKEGDAFLGDTYTPDRVQFVPVDEEVTLDGVLDDSF